MAGTGLVITFKPKIGEEQAGILRVEQGAFDNGKWKPGRRLNGDEDHKGRHLRISVGQYDIQKIKLYHYK